MGILDWLFKKKPPEDTTTWFYGKKFCVISDATSHYHSGHYEVKVIFKIVAETANNYEIDILDISGIPDYYKGEVEDLVGSYISKTTFKRSCSEL